MIQWQALVDNLSNEAGIICVDLDILRGVAAVKDGRHARSAQVCYFPVSSLSQDPGKRFQVHIHHF